MKKIYITTAIDYANGKPHIGHLYERLIADTLSKYLFLFYKDIRFNIGLDEHGLKVQEYVISREVKPISLIRLLALKFQSFFIKFGVNYSFFLRTNCSAHRENVRSVLNFFLNKGLVYRAIYRGYYSITKKTFTVKKYFIGKKYFLKGEVNYFLKINKTRLSLKASLALNKILIPDLKNTELVVKLNYKLPDLCITRPAQKVKWALQYTFNPQFTVYVWFDALLSYVTGSCFNSKKFYMYWPPSVQVIGKDILIPSHGIYYLTILKYLRFKPPLALYVHNWWLVDNTKISKSLNNGVDLSALLFKYGKPRLFNFFIIKELNLYKDSTYSHNKFTNEFRYLYLNLLVNLIRRVSSIKNKLCFKIPNKDFIFHKCKVKTISFQKKIFIDIKKLRLNNLIKDFFSIVKELNFYWDSIKPWKFSNTKLQGKKAIHSVVNNVITILGVLLSYVKPFFRDIELLFFKKFRPIRFSIKGTKWFLYKGC